MADHPHADATYPDLISTYSRADAIDDGVLVDLTEPARETGFRHPVAVTRAVWDRCVAVTPAADHAGNGERGRAHDLLFALLMAIRSGDGAPELAFHIHCVTNSTRTTYVPLRAVVGPGDHAEPVITVLLPGES